MLEMVPYFTFTLKPAQQLPRSSKILHKSQTGCHCQIA
jgi:hypothetical protein